MGKGTKKKRSAASAPMAGTNQFAVLDESMFPCPSKPAVGSCSTSSSTSSASCVSSSTSSPRTYFSSTPPCSPSMLSSMPSADLWLYLAEMCGPDGIERDHCDYKAKPYDLNVEKSKRSFIEDVVCMYNAHSGSEFGSCAYIVAGLSVKPRAGDHRRVIPCRMPHDEVRYQECLQRNVYPAITVRIIPCNFHRDRLQRVLMLADASEVRDVVGSDPVAADKIQVILFKIVMGELGPAHLLSNHHLSWLTTPRVGCAVEERRHSRCGSMNLIGDDCSDEIWERVQGRFPESSQSFDIHMDRRLALLAKYRDDKSFRVLVIDTPEISTLTAASAGIWETTESVLGSAPWDLIVSLSYTPFSRLLHNAPRAIQELTYKDNKLNKNRESVLDGVLEETTTVVLYLNGREDRNISRPLRPPLVRPTLRMACVHLFSKRPEKRKCAVVSCISSKAGARLEVDADLFRRINALLEEASENVDFVAVSVAANAAVRTETTLKAEDWEHRFTAPIEQVAGLIASLMGARERANTVFLPGVSGPAELNARTAALYSVFGELFHSGAGSDRKSRLEGLLDTGDYSGELESILDARDAYLRGGSIDADLMATADVMEDHNSPVIVLRREVRGLIEDLRSTLEVESSRKPLRPKVFRLLCEPTSGGTTALWLCLWHLREEFPALLLKKRVPELRERLALLNQVTKKSILVGVDSRTMTVGEVVSMYSELVVSRGSAQRAVRAVVLYIDRTHNVADSVGSEVSDFVTHTLCAQISYSQDVGAFRKLFESVQDCPFRRRQRLPNNVKTPFLWGLLTFQRDFCRIDNHVRACLEHASEAERVCLRIVCFLNAYTDVGVPVPLLQAVYRTVEGKRSGTYDPERSGVLWQLLVFEKDTRLHNKMCARVPLSSMTSKLWLMSQPQPPYHFSGASFDDAPLYEDVQMVLDHLRLYGEMSEYDVPLYLKRLFTKDGCRRSTLLMGEDPRWNRFSDFVRHYHSARQSDGRGQIEELVNLFRAVAREHGSHIRAAFAAYRMYEFDDADSETEAFVQILQAAEEDADSAFIFFAQCGYMCLKAVRRRTHHKSPSFREVLQLGKRGIDSFEQSKKLGNAQPSSAILAAIGESRLRLSVLRLVKDRFPDKFPDVITREQQFSSSKKLIPELLDVAETQLLVIGFDTDSSLDVELSRAYIHQAHLDYWELFNEPSESHWDAIHRDVEKKNLERLAFVGHRGRLTAEGKLEQWSEVLDQRLRLIISALYARVYEAGNCHRSDFADLLTSLVYCSHRGGDVSKKHCDLETAGIIANRWQYLKKNDFEAAFLYFAIHFAMALQGGGDSGSDSGLRGALEAFQRMRNYSDPRNSFHTRFRLGTETGLAMLLPSGVDKEEKTFQGRLSSAGNVVELCQPPGLVIPSLLYDTDEAYAIRNTRPTVVVTIELKYEGAFARYKEMGDPSAHIRHRGKKYEFL